MRIGAQVSTAGGLHKAFARGAELNCESILIFTKSNRQWRARDISTQELSDYQQHTLQHNTIFPVAVHASYLINLASADPALWERSYQALKVELERAALLHIPLLTFHPGSAVDGDEKKSLQRIAKGIKRLLKETSQTAPNTTLCLETMAGQGSQLGHTFEQLAEMIKRAELHPKLGVCLDTCHIFAAGYDIRTPSGYQQTLDTFDQLIGLERIKCFHLNDSKHPLGTRKDRHAHIGQGEIGPKCFELFLNDPQWQEHPAHLETPKSEQDQNGDTLQMDPVNLQTLRTLRGESTP